MEKISVIICVNDERKFAECELYLRQQELPIGYELEIMAIRDAESIFAAYEYARSISNNRYKIYMHQDVYLTYRKCIYKMLETFWMEPNIGMLGLVGSKIIPHSGIWWEQKGNSQYGKVLQGGDIPEYIEIIGGIPMEKPFQEVAALDGFFLMTQYDLSWRNDLFSGWHFYDISQSMEYRRNGYKVAIPYTEFAWAFHECGRIKLDNCYHNLRKIFRQEYMS